MALTSRLALEVDGRPAEQQIQAVRKALEGLTEVGLRAGPAISGALASLSSQSQSINAASASLKAVQKALEALNAAGSKTGQSLSGAAGSVSATGANAAAAEARIQAARRALDDMNAAALRATASLNTSSNAFSSAGRNAASTGGQVRVLEQRMTSLTSIASGLIGPLIAAFGATQAVSAIYQASEAYTALNSRMKLVTDSAGELAAAQKAVFAIAQGAYQPLSATAELYQRIATNQKELKLTGEGVAGVVGTISKTLSISGASASAANAALIQLGQAFASGTLRGEELNSVMEQAPALAQAIARGMGKTVGELRSLGAAGKLTADAVVKALQAQQGAVDELFNKTNVTIGNSITALRNSFTQLVGSLDQASGASASISSDIVSVSKSLDSLTSGSGETAKALQAVGAVMTGVGAAAAVLMAAKVGQLTYAMGQSIYAYYATRAATIAQAQATLNQSNADVIRARTAALAAQADLVVYRGTILQTVASGRLAEARLAESAAEARAAAAKTGLAAAQTSLLGVMGGPLGLALVVGGLAASYYLLRDNTDAATKALDDQGLTVDEVREKFEKLSGAQQRVKRLQWLDEQQDALKTAGSALDDYTYKIERGITLGPQTEQFRAMIDEVRRGQRDLDSVTTWIESQTKLYPAFGKEIADLTLKYDSSIERNEQLKTVMAGVDAETKKAALSTEELRAAQGRAQEQTKAQVAEWEKYIAKLREERDLFGANEKAQAAYAAKKMGLNAQQTEEARLIASQIDVLDKYKDAIKEADKTRQESLRKELIALYTQQQATEDAAAAAAKANKAAFEETNRASKESADKVIADMQRVVTKSVNLAAGRNILLAPEAPQQSIVGRGMVPIGAPTPKNGVVPRKTPQQLATEAIAQLNATTDPNKSTTKTKAVREDAGQKLLDDARQRYAVLQQQSREIEVQGSSTRTLGTEAKKLIELEYELKNLKSKGTLTATQKQVLAMGELNLAQQKQNAALERANELKKEEYENEAKLRAFRENLNSQLDLAREGMASSLAGAGMGDKTRQRMQQDLQIRQTYQKEMDKLSRDYNKLDSPSASQAKLYETETQDLKDALATRLEDQRNYYTQLDGLQGEWLVGVSEAWRNYVDIATDFNQQAFEATSQILSDTTSALSSQLQELVKGTVTLGEAFANLATSMADSVLKAITDIAAQWVVTQGLQLAGITTVTSATVAAEATKTAAKVTSDATATASSLTATATTTSAQVAAAGTTLAAWMPAALVASIGSFGAAAVVGGAALIAAFALIKGLNGGFSEGGYTGAGGKYEPAGVVHKGEVVWSQADIRNFGGVAAVEALRNGNVTPIQAKSSGARSAPVGASGQGSMPRAGRRGETVVNQTINVSGRPDNRTANQMAAATTRKQRQASRLG